MSNKILHIDTDLQIPNRILKGDTNKVKQITDKAQNIAFTQSDSVKQPVYNYSGYYESSTGVKMDGPPIEISAPYTITFKAERPILVNSETVIMGCDNVSGSGRGWFLRLNNNGSFHLYSGAQSFVCPAYANSLENFNVTIAVTSEGFLYVVFDNVVRLIALDKQYLINLIAGTTGDNPSHLFSWVQSGFDYAGKLYGLQIKSGVPDSIINSNLNDIIDVNLKDFNYYHRYKDDGNKKLYLSSNYLKDAVIDDNNEITSIKNSLGGNFVHSANNKPILTKNGIQQTQGQCVFDQDITIGQNNTFIGGWVKAETLLSVNFQLTRFSIGSIPYFVFFTRNGGVGYYITDGNSTQTLEVGNTIELLDYNYVSYIRMGLDNLLFINGILLSRITESSILDIPLTTNNIVAQNRDTGLNSYLYDDILFSLKEEADPTGFAIGDKVFEPPMRGAFNDKVEYDGRELVKAAGDSALFFLNTRYLDGSVIDVNNEITSIKDEFGSLGNYRGDKAFLTSEGFQIDSLCGGLNFGNIPQVLGNLNFFIGCWAKIGTNGGPFPNALIAKLNPNGVYTFSFDYLGSIGAVRFVYSTDGSTNSSITFPHTLDSNHHYFFVFRFNNTLYMGIDGTIKSINNFNVTLFDSALNSLYVGSIHGISSFNLRGHIDDVFFSVGNSIIDPTVFSVGDKVFTPPRRSSSQLVLIK